MTYYHGRENAPLVFSGTSIWDFRRSDCVALVDFVLARLWGLSKSTPTYAPRAVAPSLARRPAVDHVADHPATARVGPGSRSAPQHSSAGANGSHRMTRKAGRDRLIPVLVLLALALAAGAGSLSVAQRAAGRDAAAVLAHPGLGPAGGVAGRLGALPQPLPRGAWSPGPTASAQRPRTLTVRFLRNRRVEARPDFGGYRVYRGTNSADTTTMMLVRRYSVNAGRLAAVALLAGGHDDPAARCRSCAAGPWSTTAS